ncbi:ychF [Symbiodinium sp. CCMP2592]|nr:ychF [Symbiodinium sp. CCMP2592]
MTQSRSSECNRGQFELVPDDRLDKLASLANSEKVINEMIEYVDIAGLVRGASKGEGLGNQFLGNIRNTDAIVHVIRCFDDENVTHVDGSVDPVRDIETISLELIFADADQCEKRLKKVEREVVGQVKGAKEEKEALQKVLKVLEEGKPARAAKLSEKEELALQAQKTKAELNDALSEALSSLCFLSEDLSLLSMKPVIYAANVSEEREREDTDEAVRERPFFLKEELAEGNQYVKAQQRAVQDFAKETGDQVVVVSAQVEAELKSLDAEEVQDYLESLGVKESGCGSLVQATYRTLGLRTYFTCGPKETRAWTIHAGWKAPKAAGVIHTDFEKGFIKAATVSYDDFVQCGSEEAAKDKGKLRIEGKEYVVQEADVMHFRFN